MAINKITYIDKLEIDKDGNVSVRMVYGIEQDGQLVTKNYHRTVVMKDVPASAQMALVNANLAAMGEAQVGAEDLAWLGNIVANTKSATAAAPVRVSRKALE